MVFLNNFQVAFHFVWRHDFRIVFWIIVGRFRNPKWQLPGVKTKWARPLRLQEALAAVCGPRFCLFLVVQAVEFVHVVEFLAAFLVPFGRQFGTFFFFLFFFFSATVF